MAERFRAFRSALTPAVTGILLVYAFYRLLAYESYVTSFGLASDPLGYVSSVPFMAGAAVGNLVSCGVVFARYATGRLRPWGLDCRSALWAVVLAYAFVIAAPAAFASDVSLLLLGIVWGLTVTLVGFAAVEMLTCTASPVVLIVQLAGSSLLMALSLYGLDRVPAMAVPLVCAAVALALVVLLPWCRTRLAASQRAAETAGAPRAVEDGKGSRPVAEGAVPPAAPAPAPAPAPSAATRLAGFRATLRECSTPIMAAAFFELVCGLVNMYAFCSHTSFTISTQAPLEGTLICAVLVTLFVLVTARTPHANFVYLAVFPGIIAIFLALPFFGDRLGEPLSALIYAAYVFTAMLSTFCIVRACRKTGEVIYGIIAFSTAAMRICLVAGLALGWYFGTLAEGETFMHLSVVCVVCVYVLGMVVVLWGFRNSRERQEVKVVEVVVERAPETFEQSQAERVEELVARFSLSPRERDVLVGLAQGNTAKSIAEGLHISTSTAQGYIKSLYAKLGVNKKQQVIDMFQK